MAGTLVLWLASVAPSFAHPVSQGAMEIVVRPDGVDVRARVTREEVFVAEAMATEAAPANLNEVWQRHGVYLLAHVHLSGDGVAFAGELVGVTPPAQTTDAALATYELRFHFPHDYLRPGLIEVRQDVLNEFEFAPGNPWEATYVVQVTKPSGATQGGLLLTRLDPLSLACDWQAAPVSSEATLDQRGMFVAFLRHGVMHILGGYDHLLFMAALVLAVTSLGDLVKVVTAFTLAHTLTLTLSVLNLVRLSGRVVEPMIATSIVVVAMQNVLSPERSRGRGRLAVAFAFGLFHGLGFAGGLLATMERMPSAAIATAIAAFSLGVEIGHQSVVVPIFVALMLTSGSGDPERVRNLVRRIGSGVISLAGMAYLVAALR